MIWLNRFVLYVFLLVSIYYAWPYMAQLQPQAMYLHENANLERVAHAQKSLTYIMKKDRWTEFPLNDIDLMLRVVSNANLPSGQNHDGVTWHYSFEYQIINDQGDVVIQHIYHHRARLLAYEDEAKNPRPNKYFYANPELNPTSGQIMMINLENQPSIRSIRLRLHEKDAGIVDVNIRLYQPSPVAQHKYNFFWKRLHRQQKERLASGNLYPLTLVNEQEIHNIMANYYSPLGPTGLEGKDYDVRALYIDKLYEVEAMGEGIMPSGLLVFDGFHGTIPIHASGEVELHFMPIHASAVGKTSTIELRWYGKKREQRQSFHVPWQGQKDKKKILLEPGLLEIISQQPFLIRAYQAGQEITPKSNALRMYKIDAENSIDFAIEHVQNKATPFRLMLRTTMPLQVNKTLHWQVFDQHDQVIQQGHVRIDGLHSMYDRPLRDVAFSSLSEANYFYFSIRNKGVRLHLEAETPLLVAASSRPFQLVRHLRIPQDYEWFVEHDGEQRAWFLLRPLGYQRLLAHGHSQLVNIQTRPPVDHPDVLEGRYLWEDYHPQGLWRARYLFLKRDVSKPVRREALVSVFRPIVINQRMHLNFQRSIGRMQLKPSIIVLNQQKKKTIIQVLLDGEMVYQNTMQGAQSEIQLPTMLQGQHQLQINSTRNIQAFINHTGAGKQSYNKRLANRFDQKTITFDYQKTTSKKEALTAVFYPPDGDQRNIRLHVRIEAKSRRKAGANKGWTFLQRSFDLTPQPSPASHVLNSHGEKVGEGISAFVVFDQDLPKGKYRISFTRESGAAGYLTLFKMSAGSHEQRHLFRIQQAE